MGFISILLANIIGFIMIIGFAFLVIGIILSVVSVRRKKRGQKAGVALMLFSVVSYFLGTMMFLIPLLIVVGKSIYDQAKFNSKVDSYPVKLKVTEDFKLSDGFDIDGIHYVEVDELTPNFDDEKEAYAAIYWGTGHLIPVYIMPNDANAEMYVTNGKIFVAEDDVSDVIHYYESEASYEYQLSRGEGGHNWEYHTVEMSDEFFYNITHLYLTEVSLGNYNSSGDDNSFYLTATSLDGVSYRRFTVSVINDADINPTYVIWLSGNGELSGYAVPEVYSEEFARIVDGAFSG